MPQIVKRKRVVKRKRTSYSVGQKVEVVTYAKQFGRNKAAAHFKLDKSMVGRWVKASTSWTDKTNRNSKSIGSGRKVFYPETEKKLYDWIIDQRKAGLAVNYAIIRVKMLEIMREPDIIALYGDLTNSFRLSNRWLYAFMKRRKLSLRRRTKIGQKLPKQTEELLENFHRFVIRLRIEKSYEMCNIFNMDETPVWFDMAGNFTVDQTGEKTIHIRETGNDKNRFTVVLTCAAGRYYKSLGKSFFFKNVLIFFFI